MNIVALWHNQWDSDIMESPVTKETVQAAATSARIMTSLKENRIELIGCLILAHLLGISDRVIAQVSGMCI